MTFCSQACSAEYVSLAHRIIFSLCFSSLSFDSTDAYSRDMLVLHSLIGLDVVAKGEPAVGQPVGPTQQREQATMRA
jgi:hypothetical protein